MKINAVSIIKQGINDTKNSKWFKYALPILQILFFTLIFSTKLGFSVVTYDDIINFITTWTQRVGLIVTFIGAIMLGLGWRNDDPGEMMKGVKTAIAGLAVAGLSTLGKTWMK